MIKNYKQYINEDLRSKKIIYQFGCDNLKQLYPDIQLKYNNEYKVVISYDKTLVLNEDFYYALKKDHINKGDIIFEDCVKIYLYDINGFTKVSDYGTFGNGINNFNCGDCSNLTSLKGCPETVDSFRCYCCINISSLEFCPVIVGGDFNCSRCHKLTSLDGAPDVVGGSFVCSYCENLTSLDGSPKEVGSYFCCSNCKNLMSLDGSPEIVNDEFDCNTCKNLTSLDGAPKTVVRDFVCIGCKNLTSLDGSPEKVDGDFRCRGCNPGFITLAIEKYGKDKVKS